MDYRSEIDKRVANRTKRSFIDFNTVLKHFCIVSFKVSVDKLNEQLPNGIRACEFNHEGESFALISAVVFQDSDFGLKRMWNLPRFNFFQTNYRAYVVDENGEDSVWFFGTTLGSWTNVIPRKAWGMPWTKGKYEFKFSYKDEQYATYAMKFYSEVGDGIVEIKSGIEPMNIHDGFESIDHQTLILTHPVKGYYFRTNGKLGSYQIWHPEMELFEAKAVNLKLDLFKSKGLISDEDLSNPHSVLVTPSIEFDVLMPPQKL